MSDGPLAVFPPVGGGLHCGDGWARKQSITSGQVFPPVGGGLHCGEFTQAPVRPGTVTSCESSASSGTVIYLSCER